MTVMFLIFAAGFSIAALVSWHWTNKRAKRLYLSQCLQAAEWAVTGDDREQVEAAAHEMVSRGWGP